MGKPVGPLVNVVPLFDESRPVTTRPRVLLILGSGRSGSTLMERSLGGVPGVSALGEVVHLWSRGLQDDELCGCGVPFAQCVFWSSVGDRAFGGWDQVDVAEAVAARRRVIRTRWIPELLAFSPRGSWRAARDAHRERLTRVLEAAASVSGAQLLVDSSKMPAYAALLMRADIDLHCVEVVRDPRGVAYSMRKPVPRPEAATPSSLMHRTGLVESAFWWTAFGLISKLLRRVARTPFLTVRYEDFVDDPQGTVRRILAFAGILVTAEDLAHTEGDTIDLHANHQVAGNPVRFQTGLTRIRPDEEWRTGLTGCEQRAITLLTAGQARRHGYR